MARPARGNLRPGVFHVASHGVRDTNIFLDDNDRVSFLRLLGCVVYRFRWVCYGYCLMSNHFHLIVDTSADGLSAGMQMLDSLHSLKFNARYRRAGKLIRTHFMSERIDDDHRFMNALRYIARNPLDAGICEHPGEWMWSSYNATAGTLPAPLFLDVEAALGVFSPDRRRARNIYIDFVNGLSLEVEREMKSRFYTRESLGTCRVRDRLRPTLAELFNGCDSIESRDRAIHEAHEQYGYTLKEIGEYLGLSISQVSRVSRGVKGLHHKSNNS